MTVSCLKKLSKILSSPKKRMINVNAPSGWIQPKLIWISFHSYLYPSKGYFLCVL